MTIYFMGKYYHNVPDPTPKEGETLLDVCVYLALKKNETGNITYKTNKFLRVLNYLRIYKISDVLRKILSRSYSERIRNDKWLVCGIGKDRTGNYFYFAHPFGQNFQNKIAVSKNWLKKYSGKVSDDTQWSTLDINLEKYQNLKGLAESHPPISGSSFNADSDLINEVEKIVNENTDDTSVVDTIIDSSTNTTIESPTNTDAVLFGYGNYARTITIPYLKPFIEIRKLHEIDPALLIFAKDVEKSTSGYFEEDDKKYKISVIAGYHHTHSKLAVSAMLNNSIPIIEKPLSTTIEDFKLFKQTAIEKKSDFFLCFQKRYQSFNKYIYTDLGIKKGDPVHYKANVFEVPLNFQHWYNWKVSGTRIISNGCHWIDQFMYLNSYSKCVYYEAKRMSNEDIVILMTLENGANAVITLSDIGTSRIGVREYIELSNNKRRCEIIDSMIYKSESEARILRKKKTDKLEGLRIMYSNIGRAIVEGDRGDSINSLDSSEVTILLDEQIKN